MAKLFLIILLTTIFCSCTQSKPETNINKPTKPASGAYLKKCVEFIKQVKEKELSDSNFMLVDKPFSNEDFNCINQILADSNLYSKNEIALIKDKNYPSLLKWPKEFFKNTKLISSDTINVVFKDQLKGWSYFYKKIGPSFSMFSVPIFLKNYSYCLFYSDYYCGDRCGVGKMTLYKKENNQWVVIKTYCNWIS